MTQDQQDLLAYLILLAIAIVLIVVWIFAPEIDAYSFACSAPVVDMG